MLSISTMITYAIKAPIVTIISTVGSAFSVSPPDSALNITGMIIAVIREASVMDATVLKFSTLRRWNTISKMMPLTATAHITAIMYTSIVILLVPALRCSS